jgi:hypothetical protein
MLTRIGLAARGIPCYPKFVPLEAEAHYRAGQGTGTLPPFWI